MSQENMMLLNGLAEHYNDGSYIGTCLALSYCECCSYEIFSPSAPNPVTHLAK